MIEIHGFFVVLVVVVVVAVFFSKLPVYFVLCIFQHNVFVALNVL